MDYLEQLQQIKLVFQQAKSLRHVLLKIKLNLKMHPQMIIEQ